MRKTFVMMACLLSLPLLDYAAAGFQKSLADKAEAYGASRTAFVARGPGGGVVAGTRRTAWSGGYGFLESNRMMQDQERWEADKMKAWLHGPNRSQDLFKHTEDIH